MLVTNCVIAEQTEIIFLKTWKTDNLLVIYNFWNKTS
jgi:hypothetical protein